MRYVDAPVLGTRQLAEQGALVILATGPDDAQPRPHPVARRVGRGLPAEARGQRLGADHCGRRRRIARADPGTRGLDPSLFLDVVSGGALDAPYVQLKGKNMLADSHDPAFGLDSAVKGSALTIDAARDAGLDPSLMTAIHRHFQRAADAGHGGGLDMSATYREHRPEG